MSDVLDKIDLGLVDPATPNRRRFLTEVDDSAQRQVLKDCQDEPSLGAADELSRLKITAATTPVTLGGATGSGTRAPTTSGAPPPPRGPVRT